jgi:regulator of protease activity HflC (stomatin/prohibitin superfamily)
VFLIPVVDRPVRVDLREQFIEVPSQTTITKDNAPINIDFLIYWKIVDPLRSIVNVAYFAGALQGIATTTLRAVIGDIQLDDVLSKRDQINEILRAKLDEQTERWGGKVTTVEIREIVPPRDVQDAMNRMLSAERNRRAIITESEGARQSAINVAEGEKQSAILRAEGKRQSAILEAEGFSEALSRIFAAARNVDERTMLLQYLDTLKALGASPSTKYVLPLELTELAQRLGRFVDASADLPPGDAGTSGVRRLPRRGGPEPEVRPPTAMSPSMGTEGGVQRTAPPAPAAPPAAPPAVEPAADAPTEPHPGS